MRRQLPKTVTATTVEAAARYRGKPMSAAEAFPEGYGIILPGCLHTHPWVTRLKEEKEGRKEN